MAENDSSQEKTEEPTPKRLKKAKDDGQAPRSRELTTTGMLLAGTIGLYVFGGRLSNNMLDIMSSNFTMDRSVIFDPQLMFHNLGASFSQALFSIAPIFVVLLIAAVVGPLALGGWIMSAKSIAPKFDRLNPLSGLKRMFSMKSLIELFKSIGKVLLVIAGAYFLLLYMEDSLLGLSTESVYTGVPHALDLILKAAIILSAVTILISLIDVPFQIHEHVKKLKMSKQDIKDEMKDTEGKPEVKGKIRQLQMEMSQRRMMDAVPQADVVITNPTHFSVALKYDPDTMATPVLLAKGLDQVALRIREVAKINGIEFVESPPLARAIYHTTDLDSEIPQGLFVAVAQVLAYVFQLREYRKGRGDRPAYPRNISLPDDMQF